MSVEFVGSVGSVTGSLIPKTSAPNKTTTAIAKTIVAIFPNTDQAPRSASPRIIHPPIRLMIVGVQEELPNHGLSFPTSETSTDVQ